jgi:putative flippase GtrA
MAASSLKKKKGILQLVRAFLAGGAATIVDLAVLTLLVSGLHLDARIASIPALIAGGIVSFFANRHWVFQAREGSLPVQAALYVLVEIIALVLNGILYDGGMRTPLLHAHPAWYAPLRLVTSHIVFIVWSFPLWRFVFRVKPRTA